MVLIFHASASQCLEAMKDSELLMLVDRASVEPNPKKPSEFRITLVLALPFWLLVAPKKLGAHIQRYWYEDER